MMSGKLTPKMDYYCCLWVYHFAGSVNDDYQCHFYHTKQVLWK